MNAALQTQSDNPQLTALARIATQETPKEEIRWRPGRGGSKLPYTDSAFVIRTLNEAFGWDWDFEADNEELLLVGDKPFEVKVRGRLTVRLNGLAVTKVQFGSQPIEYLKNSDIPVSIGDAFKGAATDALKKCASLLGIALDLYDSDSPVHTNGASSQQKPQPRKQEPERVATEKEKADAARVREAKQKLAPKFSPENRNHSPEMARRFDSAVKRLTERGVTSDELLRETNCVMHDMGRTQVRSRHELDEESAGIVCGIFEKWARSLELKADVGI